MAEQDAELDEELELDPDDEGDEEDLGLVDEDDPDAVVDDILKDEPEPKKPLSRANREIIKLRRERQESDERARRAEEKADRALGSVDVLSRRPHVDQAQVQREERERLAAMTSEEREDYRFNQQQNQFSQALAGVEFRAADRADKAEFNDECRANPLVAEIRDETEQRVQKLRRETGTNVDRLVMADKILGERARAAAIRKRSKIEERERVKLRNNTTKAPGARSDVGGERTKQSAKTPRERLEALEAKGVNPFNTRR